MIKIESAADKRRWTQIRTVCACIRVYLRSSAAITSSLLSGCTPYLQVQVDLIEQSRKGVAMVSQSLDAQQQIIDAFQHQQRRDLDEAFDDDVREQASLDADWVIDHRIAYSLALDAMNESQHRQQLSRQQDQRTCAAIDLALQKLEWLASIALSAKGK